MNGIERIKNRILQDAQAYADAQTDKASKEAEEMLEAARQEAELKKSSMLEEARREAVHKHKRILAMADTQARKDVLKVKREFLEGVFEKVMEKLCSMPDDRYSHILARMILSAAGQEDAEVLLSQKDRARLEEILPAKIEALASKEGKPMNVRLSKDTANILGGFILRTGDIEQNYSFESLLRTDRDELEKLAYSELRLHLQKEGHP